MNHQTESIPPESAPHGAAPAEPRSSARKRELGTWLPTLALVAISAALAAGGEAVRQWGRYDRHALEAGQLWRLVTGHLVHLGPSHLALDLGALVLIRVIVGTAMSGGEWVGATLVSMASIDAGLYFGAPDVGWYVGLSGILHGLFVAGAAALLGTDRRFAAALLVGVAAKLAWEHWAGPLPWSAEATGGTVITAAHFYGAIGGVIFAAFMGLRRRRGARPL
ncbi:MAG TPA: rhombosortase [Gammaproteobacteria bacterium]|nr:rhombosortase [Gammaproteobacteria bacterium]